MSKAKREVTDVLCFRNYLHGNYNLNFVKSRITKVLFCVYLDKLKAQTTFKKIYSGTLIPNELT